MSGIRTTVKSDDKVKTGIEQTGAISVMYGFEQIAEKGLNKAETLFKNSSIPKNKFTKTAFYILKGSAFIAASLSGYDAGKKAAGSIVDKIRGHKDTSAGQTEDNSMALASVYDDFMEFAYEK